MSDRQTRAPHFKTPLQAALTYGARGWAVFPCHVVKEGASNCSCGFSDCASPSKHPIVAHGLKSAVTDREQIKRWWKRWPHANVGIRSGAESGFVVVDVDPAHGGLDSLQKLREQYGALPHTFTVATGSDGLHFYFAHPNVRIPNDAGRRLGPGLDIRGDGGYVIAPPSLHASGRRYHITSDEPLADLPSWLLELLKEQEQPRPSIVPRRPVRASNRWALSALEDELDELHRAPVGARNFTLNRCAFKLGQIVGGGSLDYDAVEMALIDTGIAIGLNDRETRTTVASGLKAGLSSPRVPADNPKPDADVA